MLVARFVLCLLLLCGFGAVFVEAKPLPPNSVDDNTIAEFLKVAPARSKGARASDFEGALAATLAANRSLDAAATQLAPRYQLAPALMGELARLWIRWVVDDEDRDFQSVAKVRAAQLREQYRRDARGAFLSLVRRSEHAAVAVEHVAIFLEVVDRGLSEAAFRDLLAGANDPQATAWFAFHATVRGDGRLKAYPLLSSLPAFYWHMAIEDETDLPAGSYIAMLEALERSPSVAKLSPDVLLAARTAINRHLIQSLWKSGLVAESVERFEKLPSSIRMSLLDDKQPSAEIVLDGKSVSLKPEIDRVRRGSVREGAVFPIGLAAAYVVLGRRADAAEALKHFALADSARLFMACWREQALEGACGSNDWFADWFAVSYAIDPKVGDPIEVAEFEYLDQEAGYRTGLWASLLAQIFAEPRYAVVRDFVVQRWKVETAGDNDSAADSLESSLPSELRKRIGEVRKQSAAVHARLNAVGTAKKERWLDKYRKRVVTLALTRFAEAPLRATCSASKGKGQVPVPKEAGFKIVRSEVAGDIVVALSLSQKFDPTGEASDGGYWVHISRDRGKTWERPRYTGIAQYFPYVAGETSCVPLWGGDHLNVAVQKLKLHEVLYPVSPAQEKPEGRFLLTIPLAALDLDSDGDGVPDIQEDHLLLDRNKADSDGDGINDGDDRMPNVASRSDRRSQEGAIDAALAAIVERREKRARARGESLATGPIFIEGDAKDYEGVDLPRTAFVYSRDEMAKLMTMTPFVLAVTLGPMITTKDGSRALVEWDAGPDGGAFRLVRAPAGWKAISVADYTTLIMIHRWSPGR